MSESREELHDLIEGMPDDQVEALLADVRRSAAAKPKAAWPPRFAGMIEDGPEHGSSPEYVDAALAQGFGSERTP